jgi:predicted nucleic-acid-binding Zn-ribbon protein
MESPMNECPKCRGAMEIGHIPDVTYGGATISQWTEGEPERSMLTGIKIRGKRRIEITAYRCTNCGFLEFYATA